MITDFEGASQCYGESQTERCVTAVVGDDVSPTVKYSSFEIYKFEAFVPLPPTDAPAASGPGGAPQGAASRGQPPYVFDCVDGNQRTRTYEDGSTNLLLDTTVRTNMRCKPDCEQLCIDNQDCLTYTFYKSNGRCMLYNTYAMESFYGGYLQENGSWENCEIRWDAPAPPSISDVAYSFVADGICPAGGAGLGYYVYEGYDANRGTAMTRVNPGTTVDEMARECAIEIKRTFPGRTDITGFSVSQPTSSNQQWGTTGRCMPYVKSLDFVVNDCQGTGIRYATSYKTYQFD
jgi:hypothetical protein